MPVCASSVVTCHMIMWCKHALCVCVCVCLCVCVCVCGCMMAEVVYVGDAVMSCLCVHRVLLYVI